MTDIETRLRHPSVHSRMADEALKEALTWMCGFAERAEYDQSPGANDYRSYADALESALSELARLRAEMEVATPVVYAARLLVAADTYKHPMLSRADAVKAGVAELHDAVQRWQSAQPAQRQIQSHEEKRG